MTLRSAAVHDRLRSQILDGTLAPGDAIPSERALSEELGVNRHAIREALKRLQQAGLIQVSHGGATRVLDWKATAGLDLLADLAACCPPGDAEPLLGAILEMRASIGSDAARLCAQRADKELRGELRALAAGYPEAPDRFAAYEHLWERIVDGAGNLAYRLAFNSLVSARISGGVDPAVYSAEVDDEGAVAELVDAITAGKPDRAATGARLLLERSLP